MPRRRFIPLRIFPAILALAFAVLSLATAPIFYDAAEARSDEMAMIGTSADHDAPCASTSDKADHTHGNHAQNCLALCLTAHGALLPELPAFQAGQFRPASPPTIPSACEMRAHAFGIDPPPPRPA